jgi:general secretion pathway protein A
MYEQFFGLDRHPFSITPDPGVLFLTAQHREALTGLTYAILGRKGFVVLTGDAGTGKTTLLSRVLQYLPAQRIRSSVILNSTLSPAEFLEMAMLDFGLTDIPQSKAQRIHILQQFLLSGDAAGQISALVVDEAHKLSREVLEEIRLLGNFENANNKLIQILLIGQNELTDVLNREDLRQFKQRIAVRLKLEALSRADVAQYIQHRWTKGGGSRPAPFPAAVVEQIAGHSQGIPRLINAICDNALLLAFAKGQSTVAAEHVLEAAGDLDLIREAAVETAPEASNEVGEETVMAAAAPDPAPAPRPAATPRFKMLERYGSDPQPKASLWARWFGKLGLA